MLEYPFFEDLGFESPDNLDIFGKSRKDGNVTIGTVLSPHIKELAYLITICDDLAKQTKDLVDLIFNISQLQEARAAIEEGKAANTVALSIRRVTMLTFIYLPLTLASVRLTESLQFISLD